MRLQKKIIKASAIAGIVFIIAYVFFIVKDNNISKVIEFCKNISVGIIGSLFASLLIGFVTYFFEKSKDLGNYITAYQDLFNHCSKYSRHTTSLVKLEWFNDYVKLFHQLDNAWGSIDYIFDKDKCKDYLTGVRNYYFDFIALTQDYFSAFDDEYDDYNQHQIDNIEKVMFYTEVIDRGILKHNINHNKLAWDMELVYKEVHNIYSGKHNPQRLFLKSLVNSDVFNVLNNDEEFAIRELQEKMAETNSASVRVDISDEICKALNSKGYIGSYSVDKENRIIDCRFIVYYYFELKSRLQN